MRFTFPKRVLALVLNILLSGCMLVQFGQKKPKDPNEFLKHLYCNLPSDCHLYFNNDLLTSTILSRHSPLASTLKETAKISSSIEKKSAQFRCKRNICEWAGYAPGMGGLRRSAESISKHSIINHEFEKKEEFKIIQISDTHFPISTATTDFEFIQLVETIKEAHPDLIVITGDFLEGESFIKDLIYNVEKAKAKLKELLTPIDAMQTPWAFVFGESDTAKRFKDRYKRQILASLSSFEHNISKLGPKDIPGEGNYLTRIVDPKDGQTVFITAFLDSGIGDGEHSLGHSSVVREKQHQWLANQLYTTHQAISNNNQFTPFLVFFHYSIRVFDSAIKSQGRFGHSLLIGNNFQAVNFSPANPKLFDMIQNFNGRGVFCGNDHGNDFSVIYGGTLLAQGRVGRKIGQLQPGVRVIKVNRSLNQIKTSILNFNLKETIQHSLPLQTTKINYLHHPPLPVEDFLNTL